MRVLLLTPPMTQVNTPYPATAYLTGFLRSRGHEVGQADPSLELFLRLFSHAGLQAIEQELVISARERGNRLLPVSVKHFLTHSKAYRLTVDPVVRFLQGKDPTLAHRILSDGFFPRGPRFQVLTQLGANFGENLEGAFGALGLQDRAKYLASLYIDDLSDVIRDGIDPRFELSRYAERLALSSASFDPILAALHGPPTLVDRTLDALTTEITQRHPPEVIGITIPFPGNVYGAFRMAQQIKRQIPKTPIVLGGGYVNTELRQVSDPRVFDFVDFITLDDGESPFLALLDHLAGKTSRGELLRTLTRENGTVTFQTNPKLHDIPFKNAGTPTYDGLPMDRYLSLCELLNPMHRLWSDGRWNKLTLAHGCYWKKCAFCDTSLDYIDRFEAQGANRLVDQMEQMAKETGQTGFHFVDEAAPPSVLQAMARVLLERGLVFTWWGNIRFEKTFTPELTELLARSGCVAISGGLEVASDRLLELMEKGVTVEQVARVTHSFTQKGILVHAYLMHGFPTETLQETIDSLERVRQLFLAGCLQSAFWHRFACTVHSPVGRHPERYGIRLLPVESRFARNDVEFEDPVGVDHAKLQPGLKKATYNFMHGIGLEEDVRTWFDFPVPKAKVPKNLIQGALCSKGRPKGQEIPNTESGRR